MKPSCAQNIQVDAEKAIAEGWWYRPPYIINELNINSAIVYPRHGEVVSAVRHCPCTTLSVAAITIAPQEVTSHERVSMTAPLMLSSVGPPSRVLFSVLLLLPVAPALADVTSRDVHVVGLRVRWRWDRPYPRRGVPRRRQGEP